MMTNTAYLSVRVPKEKKDALKAIANRKGVSIQNLMNVLVDNLIEQESKHPPSLGEILTTLRAHERDLRSKGIRKLYVFGSIARGVAHRESDIDIMADFDTSATISIVTLGSITAYLEEILGHQVDFGDRDSFRPEVLQEIEHTAVRVL